MEASTHVNPRAAEFLDKWNGLSPEDREGMLLATEARTLGSQGEKHGNDVGVVLVRPVERKTEGRRWEVVSWGCARTLAKPKTDGKNDKEGEDDEKSGAEDGGNADETEHVGTNPKKRKGTKKRGDQKIDIHAEMDAVAYAAREGIKLSQCTAYITRSPCSKCLPILVAAGISEIKYGDAIDRHTSEKEAARQLQVASDNDVTLTENIPHLPYEVSPHQKWLQGEETRLFCRKEIWIPPKKVE